ncbi:MAG: hypothetical protein HON55_00995, partial [Legionellales bacterium]|nr:hypothetical protein [Legionellales bacterium]
MFNLGVVMPIYKYECANCGGTVTKLQKISDS